MKKTRVRRRNASLGRGFDVKYVVRMIRNLLRSHGYFGRISVVMVVSDSLAQNKINPNTYQAPYAESLTDPRLIVKDLKKRN
ncbi:uncharacterized protein LOC110224985 [Arabidopsis lyrata subsp. lyrata]|uniref:uncharacterized protein LOC110224985 n=1 Tax=Arabidopsis lyrata subsp. lyrata TaxID=81972 RepID=UPI000A29B0DE|nr:uncharacterized protein LOC110224985 [Arabidopsis lyrata subsp. lyrata]|eukprot:XP_020868962.1 uncharacterized protein LOC110224985 [Arabidopsis lyrata subsp. lyrata]